MRFGTNPNKTPQCTFEHFMPNKVSNVKVYKPPKNAYRLSEIVPTDLFSSVCCYNFVYNIAHIK